MHLFIKNMVCNRCILVVSQELEKMNLPPTSVTLGEVELAHEPTAKQLQTLDHNLRALGFELLDNQKQKQIEKIKSLLIGLVQRAAIEEHFGLSEFLGKALHKDYSYVSRLFSGVEGMTIEQFFILQKIEKAKELLVYDELSLSEIAWKLGYSSVAHLSSQFKKLTGLTPSAFKKIRGLRKSLDKVISS